jgi:hypothetical protein
MMRLNEARLGPVTVFPWNRLIREDGGPDANNQTDGKHFTIAERKFDQKFWQRIVRR